MPALTGGDRAVHYACAVCADLQVSRLPVDPFALAQSAGITLVPFSSAMNTPGFFPEDLGHRLQMTCAVTLTYPTFCIVYRDDLSGRGRLRFALAAQRYKFGRCNIVFCDEAHGRGPADSRTEGFAQCFHLGAVHGIPFCLFTAFVVGGSIGIGVL